MELNEYQQLAIRTAKIMPNPTDMLVHGVMGCGSEPGEFAQTAADFLRTPANGIYLPNAIEELGDGLWFAAYCAYVMQRDLGSFIKPLARTQEPAPEHSLSVYALEYCAAGAELLTQVKAHRFYNKVLDTEKFAFALGTYIDSIYGVAKVLGIPVASIMHANILKLQKRYPDKYSDAAAIARADKEPKPVQHQIIGAFDPLPIAATEEETMSKALEDLEAVERDAVIQAELNRDVDSYGAAA